MNASLLEMVLAIALSGLIFASALIPTTQSMLTYQEGAVDLQNRSAQMLTLARAEQLAGAIWRDPNAPPDTANLQAAAAARLQIGSWELRQSGGRMEQRYRSGRWSTLASPVQKFSYQYLLRTGVWTTAPPAAQRANVLAVRYSWTDPASRLQYSGTLVAPDHAFAAGVVNLPMPDLTGRYQRSNYARRITLRLGNW